MKVKPKVFKYIPRLLITAKQASMSKSVVVIGVGYVFLTKEEDTPEVIGPPPRRRRILGERYLRPLSNIPLPRPGKLGQERMGKALATTDAEKREIKELKEWLVEKGYLEADTVYQAKGVLSFFCYYPFDAGSDPKKSV